jgi:dienelactone hydrolase
MTALDAAGSASHLLDLMAAHRFRDARGMFARPVRRRLSVSALGGAWTQTVGSSAARGVATMRDPLPTARVEVPIRAGERLLTASVHVNASGRVTDLQVRPAVEGWTPPAYADSDAYSEEELRLRLPGRSIGATFARPLTTERPPVAILLMGGSSFDRDGTAGRNRIGRDLALGLASSGVATLRYDKPSFVDPELRAEPAFAPSADYIPPVAAAMAALRARDDVDTTRVWLVGHSMGGRYAPRVAARVPGIAGLVLLAADASPMHAAAVRVARHVVALPDAPPEAEAMLAELERSSALVAGRRFTLKTPRERLPLGFTPGTWLELRDDDPAATAAGLEIPMLVLQGGRDYQVTVDDDLSRWRAGLDGRPGVDIRVMDADDHLFFPGAGPSSPADYDTAQHVDPEVVAAIAGFIMKAVAV